MAAFRNNVERFPVSQTCSGTFTSTGLPEAVLPPSSRAFINFGPNQIYTISANVNGTGALLKRIEQPQVQRARLDQLPRAVYRCQQRHRQRVRRL